MVFLPNSEPYADRVASFRVSAWCPRTGFGKKNPLEGWSCYFPIEHLFMNGLIRSYLFLVGVEKHPGVEKIVIVYTFLFLDSTIMFFCMTSVILLWY